MFNFLKKKELAKIVELQSDIIALKKELDDKKAIVLSKTNVKCNAFDCMDNEDGKCTCPNIEIDNNGICTDRIDEIDLSKELK